MANADLFAVDPRTLAAARRLCHDACQRPSRAARANLTAQADDSQSALQWHPDHAALVSQPLDSAGTLKLGFGFGTRALLWLIDGTVHAQLELAGMSAAAIDRWVDATLEDAGLAPASGAAMPYELDPVDYGATAAAADAVSVLGAWFGAADAALNAVVTKFGHHAVNDVAVRCWPHHFDIAALFALEEGDPETAQSIGVGLSPGDEAYAEPYIYCTPWPTPDTLPPPPANMTWHSEGFTSLVCPASRLNPDADIIAIVDAGVTCLLARAKAR